MPLSNLHNTGEEHEPFHEGSPPSADDRRRSPRFRRRKVHASLADSIGRGSQDELSAEVEAQLKQYGDALPRGERALKVQRARTYILLGRSIDEAIARADRRDVTVYTATTPPRRTRSSSAAAFGRRSQRSVRSGAFAAAFAAAADSGGSGVGSGSDDSSDAGDPQVAAGGGLRFIDGETWGAPMQEEDGYIGGVGGGGYDASDPFINDDDESSDDI
jgi:hypothetical protein